LKKRGKAGQGRRTESILLYRVKEIAELLSEFSVETEKVDDFLEVQTLYDDGNSRKR
jgi:hypothetical protein